MQDLPANTLLGEYVGVVKKGEDAENESAENPIGFGGLRADKLKDFCHSAPDQNTRLKGAPSLQPCPHSYRFLNVQHLGPPKFMCRCCFIYFCCERSLAAVMQ